MTVQRAISSSRPRLLVFSLPTQSWHSGALSAKRARRICVRLVGENQDQNDEGNNSDYPDDRVQDAIGLVARCDWVEFWG